MSLNKVLNRPLFRKEALRKGALKPITAQTGVMVGEPISTGQQQINPRTQVPAIRPNIFKRAVGDIRAFAQRPGQFFSPRTGRFTPGVGTAGLIATGGLAPIVGMGRRKLGISDESAFAPIIDYGIGGLLSINPFFRAAGMAAQAGRFGLGAVDYLKNQPIGTTRTAIFPQDLGKPLGLFDPIDPTKETRKQRRDRKKLEAIAKKEGSEGQIATDQLTQPDNAIVVNKEPIGDLNEIVTNTASLPPEQRQEGPTGAEGSPELPSQKPEAPVEEPKKEKQATAELEKEAMDMRAGRVPATDATLALAREYYNEIAEGQPQSQAKNVFLSTLVAGLMAGTTRKQGLGGALEVFGQALGPAVNNYATLALKEGEIRAKNREASLTAALNHMKLLNTGAKSPDRTAGVIQYRTPDGELRNVAGFELKDGTIQRPVVIDGQQAFVTVPQGGAITDATGKVIGTVQQFRAQKDIGKRLFDIQDVLGNRYTAYSTTLDVLKTLNELTPEGETKGAGAGLTVDAFIRRTTGVAKDLLGIDLGDTKKDAQAKLDQIFQDEVDAINRDPDLSEEEKQKQIKNLDKNGLLAEAKKRLKTNVGGFSKLTLQEQEKLAVQEVSLVYALANTFKDQDRLTQRDINAAREIVNIFSLTRSSRDVKASIEAIANQLAADIKRQERLYTNAGGLYSTILDLRQLKNFTAGSIGDISPSLQKAFTEKEIRETLQDVNL